ncbi:hypothetical protein BSL78_02347 [Apostichopus japonicus]|uniref:Carbohydrate kinase FGGY N-terminal domain-containing protein n=1 Tax=Stichopus japonicus TaxID=307972 RepID=A0A2G8LKF1_STIJA|nr:hypothetical protein BSL78_02347 [Apostichopus japonicus]
MNRTVFSSKTQELIASHQKELQQFFPKEGWVEEDPKEILAGAYECIEKTVEKLKEMNIDPSNIKAIGLPTKEKPRSFGIKPLANPCIQLSVKLHHFLSAIGQLGMERQW